VSTEIRATYRLQLHGGFGLDDAAAVTDYLAALGVSHLYASPLLQAAAGSTHGYDVVDPHRVNDELGGNAAFGRLGHALRAQGMGLVVDVVPNHMAIPGRENAWWWDVLENGPASRWAAYFDVDWDPPGSSVRDRVLLPVLEDHYGRVLDAGKLRLARDGGAFTIRYHAQSYPVAPPSLHDLVRAAAQRSASDALAFVADALSRLPAATALDPGSVLRRHRDKDVLRGMLERLAADDGAVAAALDAAVEAVNADRETLHRLLERQNYRLTFWRIARRDLGYRRFFDVNTLVGLRVEDASVFADTHALVLAWVADGLVDGIRIDHPDGLRDPEGYLRRVREGAPAAWIVAEKILAPGETLRPAWPLAGTTGYDFLNRVGGLFVDPAGEPALGALYSEVTGEPDDFATAAREAKRLVACELLGSDVSRLAGILAAVSERHRRDHTRDELHATVCELLASFSVYRTYIRAEAGQASEEDVRIVDAAIAATRAARPDLDGDLLDFIRDLLCLRLRGDLEADFVMRLQQTSGPVTAKGVEDTAFYRFTRFVALNEVGGDPGRFGVSLDAFHRAATETQACWPRAMLATSTHDTKRSEDVRARLALLSEIPERWGAAVARWIATNERHRRNGFPDRSAEYLLYQTLVGAWPLGSERAAAYMEKAGREAKRHTSWTSTNPAYEDAVRTFVHAILGDPAFCADLEAFVTPLVAPGRLNACAQTLVKLTAPGVPDVYQGTELWDLSLVDPDNRRPVDWQLRRRLLAELEGRTPEAIWTRLDEGLPKLWIIRQALALRRRRPAAFGVEGTYRVLAARGRKALHAVAFARGDDVITLVPRLVLGLGGEWDDTTLTIGDGPWENVLTGETIEGGERRVADLLCRFPLALLARPDVIATPASPEAADRDARLDAAADAR
jgi:(1->4)-alpha-D-glucan 1-alpha-D-glucosylmutase